MQSPSEEWRKKESPEQWSLTAHRLVPECGTVGTALERKKQNKKKQFFSFYLLSNWWKFYLEKLMDSPQLFLDPWQVAR